MKFAMLASIIHLKVFRTVVCLDAIDVVNVFVLAKRTAELLLHDVAMLADVAFVTLGIRMPRHAKHHVTEVVHVATISTLHPVGVVAGDKASRHAPACIGHLAASAGARLWFNGLPFLMALNITLAGLIAKVRTPFDAVAAAADAQRSRQLMAPENVRGFVPKQVLRGDFPAAATLAVHAA